MSAFISTQDSSSRLSGHVASGDDNDDRLSLHAGHLAGQQGARRGRCARLCGELRALVKEPKTCLDVALRDEDRLDAALPADRQAVLACDRRIEGIRDRLRPDLDGVPGRERLVHGARPLRLNADDAGSRSAERDSGHEASPADAGDDRVGLGSVLHDLAAEARVPFDDRRVVVGMDERAPTLRPQFLEACERVSRVPRFAVDCRAVAPRSRGFQVARPLPHDDEAVDLLPCAAIRDRGRRVARRDGDDSAIPFLGRERRELREDSPRLERARLLEQFRLDESGAAKSLSQGRRPEERRSQNGAHITRYSGPSPPSGGVSRPPLAVIAPHWTQLEAVTSTSTTLPAGEASPPSSYTWAGHMRTQASATSRRTLRSIRMWLGA